MKGACREIVKTYFTAEEWPNRFDRWLARGIEEELIFEDDQHLCETKFSKKHGPFPPSTYISSARETWLSVRELVESLSHECIDNGYLEGYGRVKGGDWNSEQIEIDISMTVVWSLFRDTGSYTVQDEHEVQPLLQALDTGSSLSAGGPVPDQTMSREGAQPVSLANSLRLLPPKPFEKCHECCQFAAIEDPKKRKICLACTDEGLAACAAGIGACAYLTEHHGCFVVAGGVLTVSKLMTGIIKCCSAKYEDSSPPRSDVTRQKPHDHIVRGLEAPSDSSLLGVDNTLL
ncbi:hypothetical protein MMC32_001078 [Xylographa parallela]|nr:hypothetical protein [Xylographa parallela]